MPTLVLEGVGRVNVSDDFAKLPPEQQQSIAEDIAHQVKAHGVAKDMLGRYRHSGLGGRGGAGGGGVVELDEKKIVKEVSGKVLHAHAHLHKFDEEMIADADPNDVLAAKQALLRLTVKPAKE